MLWSIRVTMKFKLNFINFHGEKKCFWRTQHHQFSFQDKLLKNRKNIRCHTVTQRCRSLLLATGICKLYCKHCLKRGTPLFYFHYCVSFWFFQNINIVYFVVVFALKNVKTMKMFSISPKQAQRSKFQTPASGLRRLIALIEGLDRRRLSHWFWITNRYWLPRFCVTIWLLFQRFLTLQDLTQDKIFNVCAMMRILSYKEEIEQAVI